MFCVISKHYELPAAEEMPAAEEKNLRAPKHPGRPVRLNIRKAAREPLRRNADA